MRPKTKMAGRIQPRPLDGSMTRTHSSLKVFYAVSFSGSGVNFVTCSIE
jgi:hypothetical protein